MSSTDGINNPKQTDPTSPDYWTTPGLDENGIDPIDSADPTQQTSNVNSVNKDELLSEKAKYEGQLERMSQGNPARADIEKHIQELDAQLAAADTSSDWDPNSADAEEGEGVPVNPEQQGDTAPTTVKGKVATYKGATGDSIEIHSDLGNKVNTYDILFAQTDSSSPNRLIIDLGSPNDTVKATLEDGKYVIVVEGAKGKETYKVDAANISTIHFKGAGDNKVDTSALVAADVAKFLINDKAPKWATDLTLNLSDEGDYGNAQPAHELAAKIATAAKTGDWKDVTHFLSADVRMTSNNGKEANDFLRKVLTSLVGGIDKFESRITRFSDLTKTLTPDERKEIIQKLQLLPAEVRQLMIPGLLQENDERHNSDAFRTSEFRDLLKESLSVES